MIARARGFASFHKVEGLLQPFGIGFMAQREHEHALDGFFERVRGRALGEEGGLFFDKFVIHEYEGLRGHGAVESHGATVGGGGRVEEFHAGHADDARLDAVPGEQGLGGEGEAEFGAGGDEDDVGLAAAATDPGLLV